MEANDGPWIALSRKHSYLLNATDGLFLQVHEWIYEIHRKVIHVNALYSFYIAYKRNIVRRKCSAP